MTAPKVPNFPNLASLNKKLSFKNKRGSLPDAPLQRQPSIISEDKKFAYNSTSGALNSHYKLGGRESESLFSSASPVPKE